MTHVSLVTGAGGFVGGFVVRELLSGGHAVRAMVRREQEAEKLEELGAEAVVADITDRASVERAVKGVSTIYHLAALFRRAGDPDSEFRRVNVDGTRDLLDAAIRAGAARFIHCSTVGVHGSVGEEPASESAPFRPGDVYQRSKLEGELLVRKAFEEGHIRGGIIRPAMVYGPGDERTLKLFKMIANGTFFYIGKGDAYVHFIDVRDLARSFRLLGERDDIHNQAYIIAGERGLRLHRLVSLIAANFGKPEPWIHLPVVPMQILGGLCEAVCAPFGVNPPLFRRRVDFFTKHRLFDSTKARVELGFEAAQSLYGEVTDIINSYIDAGHIEQPRIAKPSTFTRALDGTIVRWDENASQFYGWSREQAVGSVSHSLLQTEFPVDLEEINETLHRNSIWEGTLVHSTRDGARIRVQSRWERVKRGQGEILESNRSEPDGAVQDVAFTYPRDPIWMRGMASLVVPASHVVEAISHTATML